MFTVVFDPFRTPYWISGIEFLNLEFGHVIVTSDHENRSYYMSPRADKGKYDVFPALDAMFRCIVGFLIENGRFCRHFGRHLQFPPSWIPEIGIGHQIRNERPRKPYEYNMPCIQEWSTFKSGIGRFCRPFWPPS